MKNDDLAGVRRVALITSREMGSRRVDAEQLHSLISSLQSHGVEFDAFQIWQFGESGKLEYPPDRAHLALNRYDVSRVYVRGRGTSKTSEDKLEIKFDLRAARFDPLSWQEAFEIDGPIDETNSLIELVRHHVHSWPKTANWVFHFGGPAWLFVASVLTGGVITTSLESAARFGLTGFSLARCTLLAVLSYCAFVGYAVTLKRSQYNPFVWFFRPGGIAEEKGGLLPKLTLGVLGAIILGVVVNVFSKVLGLG